MKVCLSADLQFLLRTKPQILGSHGLLILLGDTFLYNPIPTPAGNILYSMLLTELDL